MGGLLALEIDENSSLKATKKNSGEQSRAILALLFKELSKILLLWNGWFYFEIISQDCSLGDPFQKLFTKFWSLEKRGSRVGGRSFFHCVDFREILQNSSHLKPLVRFWNNFTGVSWVTLLKNCLQNFDPLKNMATMGGGGGMTRRILKKIMSNNYEIWSERLSLNHGRVCENGSFRSKTRSLDQILEKPCVCSSGDIFSPKIMKLVQNVCFDEISEEFENWSSGIKN